MTAHDDRARDEQDQALQDLVDQAQELGLYDEPALRYPVGDGFSFYGRKVWPLGEDADAGVMVEGHGRRAFAALSAYLRDTLGRNHGENDTGDALWVVFHETCGCTTDEHAAHVAERDADGWVDCDCQHYGVPPCRDTYAWSYDGAPEGTPGALPVLVVIW